MRAWRTAALGAALLVAPSEAPAQLARGDVVVTSLATGLVYRLDPAAPAPMAPVPVPTGGAFARPLGIAVDRNGLLLVVDNGPKNVWRVDPDTGTRALVAQFSQLTSDLRGITALDDGRFFVANPGIVPIVQPPQPPIRGVTFFPNLSEVSLLSGLPDAAPIAGCLALVPPACGDFYFPSGVARPSGAAAEAVVLVADAGEPNPSAPGSRRHQAVLRVLPDQPPETNETIFCASDLFTAPLGVAVAGDGSVLVTDIGSPPQVPPRVLRIAASGCDPADVPPDPPVEIVAEGAPLSRPIGIAVAPDGRIFVADNLASTVFQVPDLLPAIPETPFPLSTLGSVGGAWDLQVYDARPAPYFLADAGVPELLAIAPAVPSRATITSAGDLREPASLEVLPTGAGLVVADPVAGAVITTTPGGVQTIVSQGGRLTSPTSASREAGGTYLVTDLGDAGAMPPVPPAVIRVDPGLPSPGNQTEISSGGSLVRPVAGAIDGDGYLIVADAGAGTAADPARILRITPVPGLGTGGQVTLYQGTAAVPLVAPVALTLDAAGRVVAVADATNPPALRRLVRSQGSPGLVSFAVTLTSGGDLRTPAGLAVDSDHSLLVSDGGLAAAGDGTVLRVDQISGLQSFVATAGALEDPTGVGVTAPAPSAYVDQDQDGAADDADNCINVPNADQRDTDNDGFGNACDPDYDNNGAVGASDILALGRAFGAKASDPAPNRYDPDLDKDGDGVIGTPEVLLAGPCFSKLPGQSGLIPPPATGPRPCFPAQ